MCHLRTPLPQVHVCVKLTRLTSDNLQVTTYWMKQDLPQRPARTHLCIYEPNLCESLLNHNLATEAPQQQPAVTSSLQVTRSHVEKQKEAPRNWGERVPPMLDAEVVPPKEMLKLNGIKCNEANAVDVADDLAASWAMALEKGYHVWTLHDGEHSVADTTDLSELPKAPSRRKYHGYHLRCWCCGHCYPTSRRRAVMTTGCGATRLLSKDCSSNGKVMGRCWSLESFKADLVAKNRDPARQHLHWPECILRGEQSQERWLQCTKCGYKVPVARSTRILQGVCDHDAEQVRRVLQSDHRGGQQAKFASFNIGTLRNREADLAALNCQLLAVQETNVPRTLWKSVSSNLKQLNGTVVFGGQRACDTKKRKHHEGLKLGKGIALIAFAPWSMHKVDNLWPSSPTPLQIDHRLVSGLAVCGTRKIICHGIYLDPQTRELDIPIFQELTRRIGLSSHSHHVVAGDWQTDSRTTSLGQAMQQHGWLSWTHLVNESEVTNHPPRGLPRILDDWGRAMASSSSTTPYILARIAAPTSMAGRHLANNLS